MKEKLWEPSRHFLDFHLAGFAYYDGLDVIDELKIGKDVQLVAEPTNPHDPNAVAIYYKDKKLGYVPNYYNESLAKFLYFGYGKFFEARIQYQNLEQHPDRQYRVVVKLKDNRSNS